MHFGVARRSVSQSTLSVHMAIGQLSDGTLIGNCGLTVVDDGDLVGRWADPETLQVQILDRFS